MNKIKYNKNQYIFKEGDVSDYIYIIESGKVKIFRIIKDREKVYAILNPGEMFGEIGVLSKSKRSANAFTLEETVLEIIREEEVSYILKKNPILNLIIQTLIKRIKKLDEKVNFISFWHEELRLCFYFGIKYTEEKKLIYDIEEIKYFTDIEEEKIYNFLNELKHSGILDIVESRNIILKNPDLILEHAKYLFLEEKFRKKDKLKEFHPLL